MGTGDDPAGQDGKWKYGLKRQTENCYTVAGASSFFVKELREITKQLDHTYATEVWVFVPESVADLAFCLIARNDVQTILKERLGRLRFDNVFGQSNVAEHATNPRIQSARHMKCESAKWRAGEKD